MPRTGSGSISGNQDRPPDLRRESDRRPTLIIRGTADTLSRHTDAFGLFEQLGADEKLYIVVGNATHWLSLEQKAPLLMREGQAFLEG